MVSPSSANGLPNYWSVASENLSADGEKGDQKNPCMPYPFFSMSYMLFSPIIKIHLSELLKIVIWNSPRKKSQPILPSASKH